MPHAYVVAAYLLVPVVLALLASRDVRAFLRGTGSIRQTLSNAGVGLLFLADPIFFVQLRRIAEFVSSRRLPAIANFTEFPKLGGLMGYAPSLPDEFRHAAGHISLRSTCR